MWAKLIGSVWLKIHRSDIASFLSDVIYNNQTFIYFYFWYQNWYWTLVNVTGIVIECWNVGIVTTLPLSQWLHKYTLGWLPNYQSGTILHLFLLFAFVSANKINSLWSRSSLNCPVCKNNQDEDSRLLQQRKNVSCLWQHETLFAIFEVADGLIK